MEHTSELNVIQNGKSLDNLYSIMEEVIFHAIPPLRRVVRLKMEELYFEYRHAVNQDIFCAENQELDAEFMKWEQYLVSFLSRKSTRKIDPKSFSCVTKFNYKCEVGYKCRFHYMPITDQFASVYTEHGMEFSLESCNDVTALSQIIRNCKMFSGDLKYTSDKLSKLRNQVEHKNPIPISELLNCVFVVGLILNEIGNVQELEKFSNEYGDRSVFMASLFDSRTKEVKATFGAFKEFRDSKNTEMSRILGELIKCSCKDLSKPISCKAFVEKLKDSPKLGIFPVLVTNIGGTLQALGFLDDQLNKVGNYDFVKSAFLQRLDIAGVLGCEVADKNINKLKNAQIIINLEVDLTLFQALRHEKELNLTIQGGNLLKSLHDAMEEAIAYVLPALASTVRKGMETLVTMFNQQSDSKEQFLRSRARKNEFYFENISKCSKNGLPMAEQFASVFTKRGIPSPLESCDAKALCEIIKNCTSVLPHFENLSNLVSQLLLKRNFVAHKSPVIYSELQECIKDVGSILDMCGNEAQKKAFKSYERNCALQFPAGKDPRSSTAAHDLLMLQLDDSTLRLTNDQTTQFQKLFSPSVKRRIQFPAGSDKAVIAANFIADLFYTDAEKQFMLLTVNVKRVIDHVVDLFKVRFENPLCEFVELNEISHHKIILCNARNVTVCVMTVDGFLTEVLKNYSEQDRKKLTAEDVISSDKLVPVDECPDVFMLIVEEPQHMFPFKSEEEISGQHVCSQPGVAAAVVEVLYCGSHIMLLEEYSQVLELSPSPIIPDLHEYDIHTIDTALKDLSLPFSAFTKRRLQAPAGSGKTVMAVKYIVEALLRESDEGKQFVLLTHSPAVLLGPILQLINAELGNPRPECIELTVDSVTGHKVVMRNTTSNITACVMTVDGFLLEVLREFPVVSLRDLTVKDVDILDRVHSSGKIQPVKECPSPFIYIVDEAHHVFSFQPDVNIFGQHMCPQLGVVAAIVENLSARSHLAILEDCSCQLVTEEPEFPASVKNCNIQFLNRILRMTHQNKCASVPYCRDLGTGVSRSFRGLKADSVKLFPSDKNTVEGPEPLFYDVKIPYITSWSLLDAGNRPSFYKNQKGRLNASKLIETQQLIQSYAETLIKVFVQLFNNDLLEANGVVVTFPGTVKIETIQQVLKQVTENLKNNGATIEVTDKMPSIISTAQTDLIAFNSLPSKKLKILWTAAENLAGLEMAIVISFGFRFYDHINVTPANTRVDPRAFLAVSRCTYQLIIVECDAHAFGKYFKIDLRNNKNAISSSPGIDQNFKISDDGSEFLTKREVNCLELSTKSAQEWKLYIFNRTSILISNFFCDEELVEKLIIIFSDKNPLDCHVENLFLTVLENKEHNDALFSKLLECEKFRQVTFFVINCKHKYPLVIPSKLPLLTHFDAADSKWFGEISEDLGGLTNLKCLWLQNSNLYCPIPPSLSRLINLERLWLGYNNLIGGLPNFSNLRGLIYLNLNRNMLTGVVPETINNCCNLRELELRENKLSVFPNLTLEKLENIDLYQNVFNGSSLTEIICKIKKNVKLKDLNLAFCGLHGEIPDNLKFDKLEYLNLTGNPLNGHISVSILQLVSLNTLQLRNCNLSGSIPDLSGLKQLNYLDLSENNLQEGILVLNLPKLNHLNLSKNQLTGCIPKEMWSIPYLQYLNLSHNKLNGEIVVDDSFPMSPYLSYLNLSHNHLGLKSQHSQQVRTAIPKQIWKLQHLESLILSDNEFGGTMSDAWSLPNLTNLDLSYNDIEGSIPDRISESLKLQKLKLCNNKFSGDFPKMVFELSKLQLLMLNENKDLNVAITPQFLDKIRRDDTDRKAQSECLKVCLMGTKSSVPFRIANLHGLCHASQSNTNPILMKVRGDKLGHIIGPKGSRIRQLQSSGCTIEYPENAPRGEDLIISISCPQEDIREKTKVDIEELIYPCQLCVPKQDISVQCSCPNDHSAGYCMCTIHYNI